jgi:hypothetical protein
MLNERYAHMQHREAPMFDPPHQIEGRCLCGAVTVRATPVRRHVEACHRWCGSAYVGVQCGRAVAFSGEEHVVRYRSSAWAERGFCGRCGSNLFFHYIPAGSYGLLAGLFPDETLAPLAEEIFIDEKPAYYAFDADSEKLTGAEIIAKAKAQGFDFPGD